MSTKTPYMDYVQVGIKLVSLLVLYAIYIKVDEIYQMKSGKEGYAASRFNTAKARQQPRAQSKEKFSVMNPEMDQCMASCKANEWPVQGSDISPEGQCELMCSRHVNYSAKSPCFEDMSNYPSL